ncbi:MAG: hypothetical protein NZ927_06800 [Candidatus Calescibacterium sp.]|nr:hypothetical protein [Candidatus Calescibacterium sp.]
MNSLLIFLFGCSQGTRTKILSDGDLIAPFGENSISWSELIRTDAYFERLEFNKEYYFENLQLGQKTRVFIHSPKKVTSIVLYGEKYIIPDKWEGYIIKIESPIALSLYYCIIDQACEYAAELRNIPEGGKEYFFAITPGVRLVFMIYQALGSGGFCLLGGCGVQLYSRFYLCSEGIDHVICEADEFSYRPPKTVKQYDYISEDVKEGTKIYAGDITVEIKSLKEVKYGTQRLVSGSTMSRFYSFFSDLIYELEVSIEGELPIYDSDFGSFPSIRIHGCGILAGELNCWWGFGDLEIHTGTIERRKVQDLRAKFFLPTASEIKKIAIQKLYQ